MQSISPAPPGPDSGPSDKKFSDSEWRVALDVDKDGAVSRKDLIYALWVIGAVPDEDEFKTLLATVQDRPNEIEKWLQRSDMTPEELQMEIGSHLEQYLHGTIPAVKWVFLRFLTFFFFVPMIVEPFHKIRNESDKNYVRLMKWKGGLSWTVAAWLLWMPSLLIFLSYELETLAWADVMNPAILYWGILGMGFVGWTSTEFYSEGASKVYHINLQSFARGFQRIEVEKRGVSNIREYMNQIFEAVLKSSSGFSPYRVENIDDRFKVAVEKKRRRSSLIRVHNSSLQADNKAKDPYAKGALTRTKIVMVASCVLPFILRALNGDDLWGSDWQPILADFLLVVLTAWEWWCLMEVIARRVNNIACTEIDLAETLLHHTVKHTLEKVQTKRGIVEKFSLHKTTHFRFKVDQELYLDLTRLENVYAFISSYRTFGDRITFHTLVVQSFLQGIIIFQIIVSATFFTATLFYAEIVSVPVIGYVVFETLFVLFVLKDILQYSVRMNKIDDKTCSMCREITMLMQSEESEARTALENIATYVEKHHEFEARLFGVRVTSDLVAKIMISFVATTFSAILRMGIM